MKRSIKSLLATLVVSLSLVAPAVASPYDDGFAAHDRGDYATALRLWRPMAEQGDSGAQYLIGVMYEKGQGVPQDYAKSLMWYRKAADQGLSIAQYNVGVMYDEGNGVPQDYVKAVSWYRKATDKGNASCMVPECGALD